MARLNVSAVIVLSLLTILFVLIIRFADFNRDVDLELHSLSENEFRSEKSVLITGGMGFVGRHFSHRFCKMRWKVVIVDNMMSESALPFRAWPGHLKCDRNLFEFHKADCRDFFKSPDGNRNFDLFIHLAAVVGGRSVIEGAPLHIADDLSIDAAAFQWAIDDDLKSMPSQMIYFSSSAAYPVKYQGDTGHFSLSENMIDLDNVEIDLSKPDLTYGWAKLTGEYLAKLAHSSYGLNVSVYRPMSGYGEDQHEAYPFKSIVKKGLKRLDPIPIWSNAVRDFIHIEDIVDCVLHTMFDLKNGSALNLGTGVGTSFEELAHYVGDALNYKPSVIIEDKRPKGVSNRVGDPSLMKKMGCAPQISIQKGVDMAVKFMSEISPPVKSPTSSFDGEGETTSILSKNKSSVVSDRKEFSYHSCVGIGPDEEVSKGTF